MLGDSLGVQLGQGLREAFAGQPVMIDSFARADTGLVNASIRDWPKVSAEIAQSQPRPDLVVILVGANDNQKLPGPDGKTADQLSEPWRQSYGFRVDGVLTPLRNARIPVIWVGLPVMRNARLSAAMLAINSVFQERAERQGMNYVDIWEQFSDDAGAYAADGPDIDGTMTRIRPETACTSPKPAAGSSPSSSSRKSPKRSRPPAIRPPLPTCLLILMRRSGNRIRHVRVSTQR